MFDLNYFKYCFLKPSGLEFYEMRLQDEFEKLADDLLGGSDVSEYKGDTFLYRDFQSRNVMLRDGQPYFIDFQGGRRGPVYYDLASFVWQPRAAYSENLRQKLVDTYLDVAKEYMTMDKAEFEKNLGLFILFRILQLLGAYGFRGLVENKAPFVVSIPQTMNLLRSQLAVRDWPYPYLTELLGKLTEMGIDPERIWMEDRATSTVENFQFSLALIEEKTGSRPDTLGVLSSEFHLLRARMFARQEGVTPVAIPARTTDLPTFLRYFLREIVMVWYYA